MPQPVSPPITPPTFWPDGEALARCDPAGGIKPDEALAIVETLIDTGFELIEVPLNSPDPFVSIERLCKRFGERCHIGAARSSPPPDCARVADVGGRLMVSPNVDADVLAMAQARQMVTMPGVFSPTEAFLALRCGASALKYFPAPVLGPAGIAAQLAVLLKETVEVGAVGGVSDKQSCGLLGSGSPGVRTWQQPLSPGHDGGRGAGDGAGLGPRL